MVSCLLCRLARSIVRPLDGRAAVGLARRRGASREIERGAISKQQKSENEHDKINFIRKLLLATTALHDMLAV